MSGRDVDAPRRAARRMHRHLAVGVAGLSLLGAGTLSLLGAGPAGALEPTDPVSQVVPVATAGNGGGVLVFNNLSRNPSCSVTRNLLNQSDVAVVTHVLSAGGVELDQRTLAPGEQTTFVIDHTIVTVPLFIQVDGAPSVELIQVGPVAGCDSPAATTPDAPPDVPPVAPPTTVPPAAPPGTEVPTEPPVAEPPQGEPPTTVVDSPASPAEPFVPAEVPPGEPPAAPGTTAPGTPGTVPAPGTPTTARSGDVVVAAASTPLPTTGADSRGTALAGVAVLGGGVLLVGAGRRWRMATTRRLR